MKFTCLDTKMRVFETVKDSIILPGMFIVARIDGRNFTKLTKCCKFEKPYDVCFRDYMIETTKHLMNCGFDVVYGYTQSDEISLLFNLNIDVFNRKERKFNSVLAGEASSKFTLLLNDLAVFDCRLSTFPSSEYVIDYFRWRQEDAHRNCINSYCYYKLLWEGKTPRVAASELNQRSVAWKNEFLFNRGITYDKLPSWKKRGVGIYKEPYFKEGFNPVTKEKTKVTRIKLVVDENLPLGEEYVQLIRRVLTSSRSLKREYYYGQ
jgi:tRNA(His) 5'-end guanylyltransferase